MSKPKAQPASNILLVEVPPQFIALCEAGDASPQAALRGMAAMVCGLQYDADNRLALLDSPAEQVSPGREWCLRPFFFEARVTGRSRIVLCPVSCIANVSFAAPAVVPWWHGLIGAGLLAVRSLHTPP